MTIHLGDCLHVMAGMPDNSVHAIVCDPPYGLGFMGKEWDDLPPGLPWAQECLRVLKPGGHLLAFGGSRTWHRLAVAIEDAGFEMRDSIAWLYGSGFPKSLDVSKAVDKVKDWSLVERLSGEVKRARAVSGWTLTEIGQAMQVASEGQYGKWYHRGGHMFFETGRDLPSRPEWEHLRLILDIRPEFDDMYTAAEREVVGRRSSSIGRGNWRAMEGRTDQVPDEFDITTPATPLAQQWAGWGTALKPAHEPIVVARKPLPKGSTVAANVLAHGTGALNIDATRVGADSTRRTQRGTTQAWEGGAFSGDRVNGSDAGRWPTNVVLDDHAATELDAARFFPVFKYQAKAPTRERPSYVKEDGTKIAHATVKPLDLMRWLVRLVTPPGGIVLDPFAGSGTTIEACILEGFDWIAIERDPDYLPLITQRITRSTTPTTRTTAATAAVNALTLFDTEEPA